MKSKMSALQSTAVEWYRKSNGYRMLMAAYPMIAFRNPNNGAEVKLNIRLIVDEYEVAHKEELAEKARLKKVEKDLEKRSKQRRVI